MITVGGDCGVDLAPIAEAATRHGQTLTEFASAAQSKYSITKDTALGRPAS